MTGGPRLIFGLAKSLGELGHKVVIYAPDSGGAHFGDAAQGLDIRIVKLESSTNRRPSKGFLGWISGKIRAELQEITLAKTAAESMDDDFDVVNVHDTAYRTGFFYKKRNPKAKVVWQENIPLFLYVKRGRLLHDAAGWGYWFLKRFTDKKYFSAIDDIAVLDNLTKKLREARGGRNVYVVRAGIDFQKFYAPVKDFRQKAARKEVRILAVGALNATRRFDNVIEAIRLVREWGYDARALIVAHNTWHDDRCRDDLVALTKKYHIEPYVNFRFDGMSEPELIKTFQENDVFVQAVYAPPPSHQGWGLVNFEALAAGLALIVIRSSTATEVLKDGETALFFDPLHPEQIAEKIKFLVDHPEMYQRLAQSGQTFVRENQSWKRYAEEMLKVFTEPRR